MAVFALAAVTATSASALEWGKCEAKAGGNYSNSDCTTKAKPKGTGGFEWLKASQVASKRVAESKSANVPFSGASVGGGGVLSTADVACEGGTHESQLVSRKTCEEGGGTVNAKKGVSVECEKETNSGEAAASNKVVNVNVTFTGCVVFGSTPCQSEGAAEGEIKTSTLKGKLGWINKKTTPKQVGILLEPASGKKGVFAAFECFKFIATVVGVGNSKQGAYYIPETSGGYNGIISPITPVNQMTNEFEQVYTSNGSLLEPQNVPNKLEGKHISLLEDHVFAVKPINPPYEGSMWAPASEEITNVNTPEEESEIKA